MKHVDQMVARACITDLLRAGFEISVFDGEEITVARSRRARKVLAAMATTDEDYLFVFRPGEAARSGWVRFIYGNGPGEVINDYTTNLETIIAKTNALAERVS
jgi:hypothetical protein